MSYRYVLFDLDGTLMNSREGLGNSLANSLEQVGYGHLVNRQLLDAFLGVPLFQGYVELCGLDEDTANRAVNKFEEYYLSKGIYESQLFDGIAHLLSALYQQNKVLAVATNGVGTNAQLILHHNGVDQYFTSIMGLTSLGAPETKPDVIRRVLYEIRATDLNQVVMVGDRFYDIEAAKACGLDAIGVLYGYGEEDEIMAAGATHVARDTEQLLELLTR